VTPRPTACGVITLLTDFGASDPFVGVMKGVILCHFPEARVVDLCHGIQPGEITEAAFWLERCYAWFPPGSVHVTVVDPGVGSERRIVGGAIAGHFFLAPDNGCFGPGLLEASGAEFRSVELDQLALPAPSATFHGRDVFAPLAARLASGALRFVELGPRAEPLPSLLGAPVLSGERLRGEVVTVDRFGNLITNLDASAWRSRAVSQVSVGPHCVPLRRTYTDAAPGELMALINSFGVLEIAEARGSAERSLGSGRGTPVELTLSAAPHARG
jgi:S-adenosyl-L-methionine hydrolase (adenosine-forming)